MCRYTENTFSYTLRKTGKPPTHPSFAKMATALLTSLLLSLILGSSFSHAWSQVELDLFDLVEEVNENFYDFLHIPQVKNKNHDILINIYIIIKIPFFLLP